ncbi:MAG: dipeptide epimerase [Alphaproteobacteria bacterium]|nr:dipeptide epimerase [Alphaproteobacteria bacterium]
MRTLEVAHETWPLASVFRISRDAKHESHVVTVRIGQDGRFGRGEGVPYGRYGESPRSVLQQVEAARQAIEAGIDRDGLLELMPAGAARSAVDCALWDLEAKLSDRRAWEIAGIAAPNGLVTAYTLSLDTAENMGRAAAAAAERPLLKLKLTGEGDVARVGAVRDAAPGARLIVDANEAWRPEMLAAHGAAMAGLGVDLIEQPLPADDDGALASAPHPVPICADESCHVAADVPALKDRYDVVNVKLDKTGGLTAALDLVAAARAAGLGVMVGCMVGSSLAMAPAMIAAAQAEFVDLDGPLLLARDREPPITFRGSKMELPPPELWG